MTFLVRYRVGQELREKNIRADSLDEAEVIANDKFKKWEEILDVKKLKRYK